MELEELYDMQKELDAKIIKEKGLEGQDLLPNTVLALQVELGELANEWRGFKHWSKDQQPRGEMKVQCTVCHGEGTHGALGENLGYMEVDCANCDENCEVTINPLLEEYVDCLHFFLSIAVQNDWLEHLYIYEEAFEDSKREGLDGGTGGALREVFYWLSKMHMENDRDEKIEKTFGYSKKVSCFKSAWFVFIVLGLIGFGFTFDQVEEAYVAKNAVNHERQANGY